MSQPYEQLKLENQLCFPLYACARKMVNLYTPVLKPLGLTYTQYIVFMVLWEKEEVSVGELGRMLHLDAGTLTPLLKNLEKSGYVTRERMKEDERVTKVCITKEGDALKEVCREIPEKIAAMCGQLDKKDAEELYRILHKMLET
ncbi:MAG: MarR family transcriptional regulator [Lachnospiraceae bacterium]|nr:MarR family transcriptional regulator [Lachnospiraceae bacterium]